MSLVDLIIYLAVIVIVILVVWFLLSQINLPPPMGQIVTIVLVVLVAVIAIIILLNFLHGGMAVKIGMMSPALVV
jgi:hypothetical protein